MARQHSSAAAAPAMQPSEELDTTTQELTHEDIALLAYSYWQARGCPEGSPEEDWFRAESELKMTDRRTETTG